MRALLLGLSWTLVLTSFGPAAAALEIRTYTASQLGFFASSHLLLGEREAILVDAQFTRSEAYDVVRLVESSQRVLTTIFITHARPEHYLGLEVLVESFPDARVLARPATAEAIRQGAADAIARWQLIYLDDLPAEVILPEPFEAEALFLEEAEIRLLDFVPEPAWLGESHPTLLYVPAQRALLASDLGIGKVHLWLAGVDPARWLASLEAVRELGPIDRVYPGHGRPAGEDLLGESAEYLSALSTVLTAKAPPSTVARRMADRFPDYQLLVLLEQSLKADHQWIRR